jgi:hypothetical protein
VRHVVVLLGCCLDEQEACCAVTGRQRHKWGADTQLSSCQLAIRIKKGRNTGVGDNSEEEAVNHIVCIIKVIFSCIFPNRTVCFSLPLWGFPCSWFRMKSYRFRSIYSMTSCQTSKFSIIQKAHSLQ